MVKLKRVAHHSTKLMKAEGSKQLWNMINELLGKVDNKLPDHQDAEALAESFKVFFDNKVGNIRESIIKEQENAINEEECVQLNSQSEHERSLEYVEDLLVAIDYDKGQECAQEDVKVAGQCSEKGQECTPDEEDDQYQGIIFDQFQLITEDMLLASMKSMSQKFCTLDPVPVWLLLECFDEIKLVLLFIVNSSLENGKFPSRCKVALVKPTIKSKSADPDNLASFRPVSNISFLSKLLEKVGATQFNLHLEGQNLHCPVQSGYRPRHSCETLMIKMMNDILHLIEQKNTVALILLDLSAAFDTIDHDILLNRLETDFGIKGVVLEWFRSYLKERTFTVLIGDKSSSKGYLWFGVPQGSILGPILFILYTKALQNIAKKYGILIQLYADDSQLYIGFKANDPLSVGDAVKRIEDCLREIKKWMRANFMKLNNSKTELILLGTVQMLKKVEPLQVDVGDAKALLSSQEAVTSLGVKLDANLNLKKQVAKVKQNCFYTISNLGRLKNILSHDVKMMLVKQLVLSRVDYHNALYANLPDCDLKKLQSVLNAAVRFIYNAGRRVEARPLLIRAHILPVRYRIRYKVCLLTYKALHGFAPDYITSLLKRYIPTRGDTDGDPVIENSPRRSNDHFLLQKPTYNYTKSSLTKRSFSYAAPDFWNQLPYTIRSCNSKDIFAGRLKTHLFSSFVNDPLKIV